MQLSVIPIKSDQWNKTVKSFSNYSVFDLNEYQLASCEQESETPVLLLFEHGNQRAMITFLVRDIAYTPSFSEKLPKGAYFDISSAYGYGGMISDSDYYPVEEYADYCRSKGYISDFVRFNLFSNFKDHYPGDVVSNSNNVVVDLEQPVESIVNDYDRKVRKNIRTAERNELTVIEDPEFQHLDAFLRIYYSTMERNEAKDNFYFPREYFATISQMKTQNASLFHVMKDEDIISSELVLYDLNYSYSFLGGTDSTYFKLRPNELLKDFIIKWAHSKGHKKFVLGGGYGEDDGIFFYKKCFAPNEIFPFYTGRSIINSEMYSSLCNLRKQQDGYSPNHSFFPLYRS